MNKTLVIWTAFLTFGIGFAGPLKAAIFRPIAFTQLVKNSAVIVEARVVSTQCVWGNGAALSVGKGIDKSSTSPELPDQQTAKLMAAVNPQAPVSVGVEGGKMIFTQVVLEKINTLKGSAQTKMEFSIAGGSLDGVVATVPGMPKLAEGKRYILFLRNGYQKSADPFVGGNQGFFKVETNPRTGADVITNANSDYVVGIEKDNVVLRRNPEGRALAGLSTPQVTAPPIPDNPNVKPKLSAEVQRYLATQEAPLTPSQFASQIRSATSR